MPPSYCPCQSLDSAMRNYMYHFLGSKETDPRYQIKQYNKI